MPSDLTTVKTVTAGDYEVRVAQTSDGRAWEAVVLTDDAGTSSMQSLHSQMLSGYARFGGRGGGGTESGGETAAPSVTAPHKWVAVGFAIERYEWGEVGEDTADTDAAYKMFAEDAEIDVPGGPLLDPGTVRTLAENGEFSGSFTLDTGDGDTDE